MNSSEEQYIFRKFAESYKYLPEGTAEFRDKPDVIYKAENGEIIGVEITEGFYNQKLKSTSEYLIKFNNNVVKDIEKEFPFTFILDIELDNNYPIKSKFLKSIINKVKEICVKEFSDLLSLQTKRIENFGTEIPCENNEIKELILEAGYRNLPNNISSITMTRFDKMERSYYFENNAGIVPEFTDEILSSILAKKERSLSQYDNCDQNWLLISEAMDFYSYFSDINIKNDIISKFDKIFIYRRFNSELIVIK